MTGFADGDATDAAYAAWVRDHDTPSEDDRAAAAEAVERLPSRPLISLVVALGFDRFGPLAATVASLRGQSYPHWEFCIAGPASADDLASVLGLGTRLRAAGTQAVTDAADALNAALALAGGSHVALLGVGEVLGPDALAEIAAALGRQPDAELIYTDEDAVDTAGQRHTPRLKRGWDPDLLLACDCVGSLAAWTREAIERAGGVRRGFGRAAGYDLALRTTRGIAPPSGLPGGCRSRLRSSRSSRCRWVTPGRCGARPMACCSAPTTLRWNCCLPMARQRKARCVPPSKNSPAGRSCGACRFRQLLSACQRGATPLRRPRGGVCW
jgi:hypothetical protein